MAPDRERPADVREMTMTHRMFRREFGAMLGLVRAVAPGDQARREVVAEHLDVVMVVLARYLHGQDVDLLPRLLERVPASYAPLVEQFQRQHAEFAELTARLQAALGRWRGEDEGAPGEQLADLLDELAVVVDAYTAAEEAMLAPLMRRFITAAEWERVVQHEAADTSPDHVTLIFGMLMYEADSDLIDAIVADMPPEVRPVITQVAMSAYAAHALRVYGTPRPPRSTS